MHSGGGNDPTSQDVGKEVRLETYRMSKKVGECAIDRGCPDRPVVVCGRDDDLVDEVEGRGVCRLGQSDQGTAGNQGTGGRWMIRVSQTGYALVAPPAVSRTSPTT